MGLKCADWCESRQTQAGGKIGIYVGDIYGWYLCLFVWWPDGISFGPDMVRGVKPGDGGGREGRRQPYM